MTDESNWRTNADDAAVGLWAIARNLRAKGTLT